MSRFRRVTGCVAVLLLAAPSLPAQRAASGHVDREGEPLPAQAIARIGSTRLRAAAWLEWFAYAPDGKTIVGAVRSPSVVDGWLQFWDAATGRLRHEAPIQTAGFINHLRFDRDGNLAYVTFRDSLHVFKVLDGRDGKEIRSCDLKVGRPGFVGIWPWVCNVPKASLIAVRKSAHQIVLFDTKLAKEHCSLTLKAKAGRVDFADAENLAFTPDGTALAVASQGDLIEVFGVDTGNKRCDFTVPLKRIDLLEFSPDGRHLFCSGNDRDRLLLRDWAGKRDCIRCDFPGSSCNVAFTPDGQLLALGAEEAGYTAIFSAANGKEVRRLRTGKDYHGMVAFSPDGRTLATASHGAITQWRVATGERLSASGEPMSDLTLRGVAADGKGLLAYTNRHQVFDWTTGRHLRDRAAAESAFPGEALLSPDERVLAVARAQEILLFDARTGKELRRLAVKGADAYRHQYLAAQRLFALGSDNTIRVWDVATFNQIGEMHGPSQGSWLEASLDGRYLALKAYDRESDDYGVRLWDVDAGNLLHQFTPSLPARYMGFAFAPDSRSLALVLRLFDTKRADVIRVVTLPTGKEIAAITVSKVGVGSLALSPDGRTVATGDFIRSTTLRLWEAASGNERHAFAGHRHRIDSLLFSADGALLASASSDAPGLVWDIYGKHATAPPIPWAADEGQRLWQALAGADAKAAFQVIRRLVANPGPAVTLLRAQCKPAAAVDAKRVRQWLRDLDGDDADARDNASRELGQLGDYVEAALIDALHSGLGLEAKRRIEALLAKLNATAPEPLRLTRALEALEQIGTPDAVRLVATIAAGEPAARVTRQAAATLERLRRAEKGRAAGGAVP